MIVRRATQSDYLPLAKLWFESWQSIGISNETDLSRAQVTARFLGDTNRWSLYAAETAGALVGMLALLPEEGRLDQLFVAPGWQGCGVGQALLNHAREVMPGQITLTTHDTNLRARAFYERNGFELAAREDDPAHRRVKLTYLWTPKGGSAA